MEGGIFRLTLEDFHPHQGGGGWFSQEDVVARHSQTNEQVPEQHRAAVALLKGPNQKEIEEKKELQTTGVSFS